MDPALQVQIPELLLLVGTIIDRLQAAVAPFLLEDLEQLGKFAVLVVVMELRFDSVVRMDVAQMGFEDCLSSFVEVRLDEGFLRQLLGAIQWILVV